EAVSKGIQYYASAGNAGHKSENTGGVWEGEFRPGLELREGVQLHDFGNGNVLNMISHGIQRDRYITLQWNDRWGESGNDYELFLFDQAKQPLSRSAIPQSGSGLPYEHISTNLCASDKCKGYYLAVGKHASAQPRFLHLNTNRGGLAIATNGQ